jgi:protein gp37
MGENSKIEWTDHTWNPWIGCTHVSEGCRNCYAEADFDKRRHVVEWGPGKPRVRTSEANWKKPLAWNRKAEKDGVRPRVFCASLADWLDPEVPVEWLADLLAIIKETPHLDWLLLTKRPELWRERLTKAYKWCFDQGMKKDALNCFIQAWIQGREIPSNVWIGASVENQKATSRIPHMLQIPGYVRFLSCEPLLGSVDLTKVTWPLKHDVDVLRGGAWNAPGCLPGFTNHSDMELIHWVICGGESGPNARPMHPDWARSLRDQCVAAGIPFHFKQWGEFSNCGSHNGLSGTDYTVLKDGTAYLSAGLSMDAVRKEHRAHFGYFAAVMMCRCGKKNAGRLLDGREFAPMQPRQFWFRHPFHTMEGADVLADAKADGEEAPWKAQQEAAKEAAARKQKDRRDKIAFSFTSLSFEDGFVHWQALAEDSALDGLVATEGKPTKSFLGVLQALKLKLCRDGNVRTIEDSAAWDAENPVEARPVKADKDWSSKLARCRKAILRAQREADDGVARIGTVTEILALPGKNPVNTVRGWISKCDEYRRNEDGTITPVEGDE